MFESLNYLALQQYWWFIISLLGGALVFLLFVQGGQTLIYRVGKTELERKLIVNALGRKWEFTFTTLVVFGGAFFASFPLFYSTSFGGAYWVWIIILFCFVIQAVAYEFRSKPQNVFGHRTYETFLLINGIVGTIFIGTAVATFFTGSEFWIDPVTRFSQWKTPYLGLEAAFNPVNLALGLAVFFLARSQALLYFMNNINHTNIINRSRKLLWYNAIPFVFFFLFFVVAILTKEGFAYDAETLSIRMEPYKYLHNLLEMPITLILFLGGIVLVLYGLILSMVKTSTKGIWYSGSGSLLTVMALFFIAGYNQTAFYPSTYGDLQSSLHIQNASSSEYTLTIMAYVSLFVPFVAAYIFWAWRAINNKKIDPKEMESDTHIY